MNRSAHSLKLITASAICDAQLSLTNDNTAQPAILIERETQSLRVLAVGPLTQVQSHPACAHAKRLDYPEAVLLPALVNAHTHLDLSHIGPQLYDPDDGFATWLNMVIQNRHTEPEAIAQSVRTGVDLLKVGGVGIVGDIAGAPQGQPTLTPFETLAESGLAGVSFLEFFATGGNTREAVGRMRTAVDSVRETRRGRIRFGLQPHAPNTVRPDAYIAAGEIAQSRGLPLITHLAESIEEREFIAHATGPQRDLIERFGSFDDETAAYFGKGLSPVQHLAGVLASYDLKAVHLNQCSDEDLDTLAMTNTGVVFCPRASAYFGADRHFGPHRYRDMLDRGITVALGTDSIINLPPGEAAAGGLGLSTLAEARYLFARDHTDPDTLLAMITTHGVSILGMDTSAVSLHEDAAPLGLIAVHAAGDAAPMERVLKSSAAPEWVDAAFL